MPSINYGTGAYSRTNGNFPPLSLVNMFVEKAKTSENEVALLSRKGLTDSYTVGSGPINGIFFQSGLFGDAVFTISGNALYRDTTLIGTIDGSGPVKWAASSIELVVTRGTRAWSYNGTNLAAITFPDSAHVTSVVFIASLFVFARASTGEFYWSSALDARTIDALDFATAESSADDLTDMAVLGDNIWMFGKGSVEVWGVSGELDLPFTRTEQVVFDKGIHSTGAVAAADNSIIYAGVDGVVYRIAQVPTRISDHWLEAKISGSTVARLFAYKYEGHEFVAVRLDNETFAFDMATGEAHELQTASDNWIANCATMNGAAPYFGHSDNGKVMVFDDWADLDDELERRFTAASPLDTPLSINRISLWANVGQSDVLSGSGSAPVIEMRLSADGGQSWTDWDDASLGNASLGGTGEYRVVPEWRALGMFDFPGFMAEWRVTDPVPFRVSAVKINDPAGGRGRG